MRARVAGPALGALIVATSAAAAGGPPRFEYGAGSPAAHHHVIAPIIAAPSDTSTTAYEVAGVRVIHRRVTANDVVAANLYLLGGTRQVTAANAGIEPFLLEVSERGTRRFSKEALRRRMAQLGSRIVVEPGDDWTVFGIRSDLRGFDSTWSVFADRLMNPTLDSAEVELVREQLVTAVRQRQDSPDALVNYLADSVAFAGHPYGLSPVGTEATLAALARADLRRYHADQMVTSRMLLVVVGNVPREKVEGLVRATVGRLPKGSYAWSVPSEPLAAGGASSVVTVQRQLPTNYILGYFGGPPATSPDYQALRIATAILSGRMFEEIRSRRNLTYAVHAPFVERAVSAGGLYVTTVAPDTTLALMRREIGRLQREPIVPQALERLVQQFITEYFLDNETNADQANFLARAYLYRGDHQAADRFVDELRKVTPEDVRRVSQKYMRGVRFAYVGDPGRLTRSRVESF